VGQRARLNALKKITLSSFARNQPRLLSRPARSLVTIPPEGYRLLVNKYHKKNKNSNDKQEQEKAKTYVKQIRKMKNTKMYEHQIFG
jgi:hypothetical protein